MIPIRMNRPSFRGIAPALQVLLVLSLSGGARATEAPPPRLPSGPAGDVVRRALQHAGGWAAWEAKKSVSFRKTSTKFRPDGTVERTRVENHTYELHPGFRARIEREEEGKKVLLTNDGVTARKLIDGREATAPQDVNNARNSTFGSNYVFCMPWKLTDRGVQLDDAGEEILAGGTRVRKVRVTYEKGAGDAGSAHVWTYYFEAESGRLVRNHLRYDGDKYDLTDYLDERVVSGLAIAAKRISYASDEKGTALVKVSEVVYDDIRFDVPLTTGPP